MTRHALRTLVASVAFLAAAVPAIAGGPLLVFQPGVPYRWPNGGVGIPFNPDQGGLGPLNNAQAIAQTASAFAAWEGIPSATATHTNAGTLPFDVNITNFLPFLQPTAPDGLSAIVFDANGEIFDLLFGPDSGILGFAGPEWLNTTNGTISEGMAFMNGGALIGPNAFPITEFLSVQVHEFGHYQNLAHTVVNGQAAGFGDTTGPTPADTFPHVSFGGLIETMYPFLFVNGGQATPARDDIAMFSYLYPAPGYGATVGTITGRIRAPNGTTPVTGVNVIARNVASPLVDAVSAISSDFTNDYTPGAPFVGTYTIRGLTPGASYAVYVDEILAGGFSTPPKSPLPGPEEFYNGAGESNDFVADVPTAFTPVVPTAGVPITGIDIVFNRLPPGPLPVGDDSSFELFTDFPIRFCGTTYESVYVNGNGNLTFGAPSADFAENPATILLGPPRIAGLFDDLDPSSGGVVSYEQTSSSVTIHYTDVPEFGTTNANTFAITLRRTAQNANNGGRYAVDYGAIAAVDGAAGYSCGGKVTSGFEVETDLTPLALPGVLNQPKPAIFEVFTAADNDLDNKRFDVLTPRPAPDQFEPNDTAAFRPSEDKLVLLPFNTLGGNSTLDRIGDVDFYHFRAKAGDILAIETVPGATLDTLLGLFDASGNLLLGDDDGGATGPGGLSRLLVRVGVDGIYTAGVTTYPDFGFTGAGSDTGRYVLSIRSYRGTILPVGDDTGVSVPITGFTFPFNGKRYSSVFVNGNGNLTFGAPDDDFSETAAEFVNGPPRIAALWDDLSPADLFTGELNGLVIAEQQPGVLRVSFVSVPEFATTGTNYFTVNLYSGGEIIIEYGATNRSDAIVGVTPGGGVADPGSVDLSRTFLTAVGTIYERFLGSFAAFGGTDISFTDVKFR